MYDIASLNTGTVKFSVETTNKTIKTRIKEHIEDNKRSTALTRLQNKMSLQIGLKKIIEVFIYHDFIQHSIIKE